MAYPIEWSDEAKKTYLSILEWLNDNWSDKEVRAFVQRTQKVLSTISSHPEIYKTSLKKPIHKAVISKQTTLIYSFSGSIIYLVTFWDNRQNPSRLPY